MRTEKKKGGIYSDVVSDLVKKAYSKDSEAKPQTLMIKDVKKDPELKPNSQLTNEEDEKRVEAHIKKMQEEIK
mgnify:CR=1 FL=1